MKNVKKYRVNQSEHFNLYSMYEHLKWAQEMMEDGEIEFDGDVYDKLEEVEVLLDKAPFVGSCVDWPTLKRIREIKDERQYIRYCMCIAAGDAEEDAAIAFTT